MTLGCRFSARRGSPGAGVGCLLAMLQAGSGAGATERIGIVRDHTAARRAGWLVVLLFFVGVGSVGIVWGGSQAAAAPPKPGVPAPTLPRNNRIHWQSGDYFLTGLNYPFYGSYGADIATLSSED